MAATDFSSGTIISASWLNSVDALKYPEASSTPTSNGELVLELTSNTSLKIKVKGLDGTVRSVTLTLS